MSSDRMPQAPNPWASRAIRLAVRVLPEGLARDRYRHEFLAELYGMSRPRQLRHAINLLIGSFALRAAVDRERQPSSLELVLPVTARKPLLCRLNLHHKWIRLSDSEDEGEDYLQCRGCGRVREFNTPNIGGNMAGVLNT
jgi:hypothetical protein